MKVHHVHPAGWVDSANTRKIQPSHISGMLHVVEWEEGDIPPGGSGGAGADGKSAYQIWLDAGNAGTEADFLAALVGPVGPAGPAGSGGGGGAAALVVVPVVFVNAGHVYADAGRWIINTAAASLYAFFHLPAGVEGAVVRLTNKNGFAPLYVMTMDGLPLVGMGMSANIAAGLTVEFVYSSVMNAWILVR